MNTQTFSINIDSVTSHVIKKVVFQPVTIIKYYMARDGCLFDFLLSQIRNGDNISFLFASVLPKLFSSSVSSFLSERLDNDRLIK